MTGRTALLERLPSAGRALRFCLIVQVLVAAALVSEDVWDVLTLRGRTEITTVPTKPIEPGHQVRPYERVTVPGREDPALRQEGPVRLPDRLPRAMTFTLHETKEHGLLVLLAGEIEEGDASRFLGFLDGLDKTPRSIALHSPGGSVFEALEIGREIRDRGLTTVILPDAACLSACPYVLAGGVERHVSRAGWVGLHQHYFDENILMPAILAVEGIQHGQAMTLAYLDEMGVDPMLLEHVLGTPPDEIYILNESELADYRVATRLD